MLGLRGKSSKRAAKTVKFLSVLHPSSVTASRLVAGELEFVPADVTLDRLQKQIHIHPLLLSTS